MNFKTITKSYAADPEKGFPQKDFTAVWTNESIPTTLALISL